jgi:DNA modification methylase
MSDVILHHGDCLAILPTLEPGSVHACITSPPYYGQRDYGVEGQIGLEETPDEYVAKMVDVFRGVRRVMRDEGVLFLNLGDSYCNAGSRNNGTGLDETRRGGMWNTDGTWASAKAGHGDIRHRLKDEGIKHKDLIGIPWRVAFDLQADGWYLRDAIIWAKAENDGESNEGTAMPGSQRDRCTFAYEMVFLLTKQPTYYFDLEARDQNPYNDTRRAEG